MPALSPVTFEEFAVEAARGGVVPVVRTRLADLHTPVSMFLQIAAGEPHAFLLESIEGGEHVGRYSFVGAKPKMIVRGVGEKTFVEQDGRTVTHGMNAVAYLRQWFSEHKLVEREGLPPLAGGAIGYMGYEAARWFEPVLAKSFAEQAASAPDTNGANAENDALFLFCDTIVAHDHVRQQLTITTLAHVGDDKDDARLHDIYTRAVAETERVDRLLDHPLTVSRSAKKSAGAEAIVECNWSQAGYENGVRKIQEHILAGDCYQAVLSLRFSRSVQAEPLEIYRALRTTNPSPYMFLMQLGEEALVGSSPEMLVRCRGRALDYRPIAGTRKRGKSAEEDRALAHELLADEKENAEHMMLVDLGRNDLGRVAEYGTVHVDQLRFIERYSHVMHMVTALSARLREGLDSFDALASCFPAGTVSGAPKIRAMEILAGIEPTPRGVYAGSILYVDYAGNLDSCIAIRTMRMHGNGNAKTAEVQAGAGIVADSVPANEYEECMNKAKTLLAAIARAEEGL